MRLKKCPDCEGAGCLEENDGTLSRCDGCGGDGEVDDTFSYAGEEQEARYADWCERTEEGR